MVGMAKIIQLPCKMVGRYYTENGDVKHGPQFEGHKVKQRLELHDDETILATLTKIEKDNYLLCIKRNE